MATPNRDQADLIERLNHQQVDVVLEAAEEAATALASSATRIAELLAADEQRARDISRLTVERDEARDRLASLQSELDEARGMLNVDSAAKHLRETMQAGKNLTPWERTPKATKKKWIALAEGTLAAARAATRTAGGEDA